MKLIDATGLRWENPENSAVYMMATFEVPAILAGPKGKVLAEARTIGPIPFSASADDETEHGRAAFADVTSGRFGEIAPVAPVPIEEVKAGRMREMRAACQREILGGFSSSALGTPHDYPSGATDQTNLMGSVVAAMVPNLPAEWTTPFWCANAAGEWAFRPHTAAQIIQAGLDGKGHVVDCQMRLASLAELLAVADDADDVSGIVWE